LRRTNGRVRGPTVGTAFKAINYRSKVRYFLEK
jgi:hypothetical protein